MANEIKTLSPEEVRYWDVQNIPTELIKELRRRKNSNNIGFEISNNIVSNFKREHKNYKGSMSPWIRIFSNGTGIRNNERVPKSAYLGNKSYDGFILESGKSFNDAYGLSRGTNGESIFNSDSKAIIGYQANGSEHYIDQKYRESIYKMSAGVDPNFPQNSSAPSIIPPPGIDSVTVNTSADMLTYGEFKLKCFTLAQIEYLTPFFLTPGIHIFIEFGWNLYNQESILDLKNVPELKNVSDVPYNGLKRTLNSYGNYGLVSGIITNYNFTTNDGFEYDCNIKITDKQALFAGFRVDVDSNKNVSDESQQSFMNIKSFFKQYLSFAKDVIYTRSNFYNYINATEQKEISENELNKYLDAGWEKLENSRTIKETSEKGEKLSYDVIIFKKKTRKSSNSNFYKNQAEDRIFFGRDTNIDGTLTAPKQVLEDIAKLNEKVNQKNTIDFSFTGKSPENIQEEIKNLKAKIDSQQEKLLNYAENEYSDQDQHDFDRNESSNEAWFTLGFVFENINFKCNPKSNTANFIVDIDDVIVNAHPNLISCTRDVLIPNSIAPKINIGRKWTEDTLVGGYLPPENTVDNKYFNQNDFSSRTARKPEELKYAYEKNQKVFKTQFPAFRQDLDKIINYRRTYTSGDITQYAFPQVKDNIRDNNTFKKYRHGYLKDLYISKRKLIDISQDDDIKTLQQFIYAILNTVNKSVNNFWEFDVVSNGKGGFIIVDKGVNSLTKIYQFELYSDNNVIKSINFDVSLSNEQAAQTLFGSGNNKKDTDDGNQISLAQKSMPTIAYSDRFDKYNTDSAITDTEEEDLDSRNRQIEKYGIPNADRNREIEKLQIYGRHDCLVMTTMKFNDDPSKGNLQGENLYYMLNLPPTLNGKLLEILDDGDYENNSAVYSNVADNFLIELTLDGMYGFRMFQHFSINNLPKPYVPGNCIFMIKEISHQISEGNWETKITAMLKGTVPNKIEYELI
jgi:hypothetical protein